MSQQCRHGCAGQGGEQGSQRKGQDRDCSPEREGLFAHGVDCCMSWKQWPFLAGWQVWASAFQSGRVLMPGRAGAIVAFWWSDWFRELLGYSRETKPAKNLSPTVPGRGWHCGVVGKATTYSAGVPYGCYLNASCSISSPDLFPSSRGQRGEKEISSLLVHFSHGCEGQSWARPKSGVKNSTLGLPCGWQGHNYGASSAAFQGTLAGS